MPQLFRRMLELNFLRAVYLVRMWAAVEAAPYMHAKR